MYKYLTPIEGKQLERILKNVVDNCNIEQFDVLIKKIKPLLYDTVLYEEQHKYFSISDSLNLAKNFIKDYDEQYYYEFLNTLSLNPLNSNAGIVFEFSDQSYANIDNDLITVNFSNDAIDSLSIVHELFHQFSCFNYNYQSSLVEYPSIMSEFLFVDYLKNSNILNDEILNNFKAMRLSNFYENIAYFYTIYQMIKLYEKNETFNNTILNNYIKSLDENSLEFQVVEYFIEDSLDNILENREYTVHELLLYIIGTLLSCYTHQQLINNEITLDDVKLQINNILRTDLNNISKYNLPIIDSRGLNFNNIDILCKSYKKELNSLSSKR